ncbi:hypothetical protein CTI12_AA424180 [Artemisia annua]|uniref:Uncharacterized protein n=1 Tax=Artemisia annua TaxID=35608 RepID=A0A2U1M3M7_ARTAN|nr:hypothetical protein CTI12_AA424180 [Artemisia annua]
MEKGFLSPKERGSGKGVKEKQGSVVGNIGKTCNRASDDAGGSTTNLADQIGSGYEDLTSTLANRYKKVTTSSLADQTRPSNEDTLETSTVVPTIVTGYNDYIGDGVGRSSNVGNANNDSNDSLQTEHCVESRSMPRSSTFLIIGS